MKHYFALGAYTEPIVFGTGEVFQGTGKGVAICAFENGQIELVSELAVRNASFVCVDEQHRRIYAVNEMKEYMGARGGGLTQISYDKDLNMKVEGTWNTGGMDPCHIEIAPNGRFLAIANFASGSVTTFPLDTKGNVIGDRRKVSQHEGRSVHPVRQRGPHAHSCIFCENPDLLLVPDLGLDRVVAYDCAGEAVSMNESLSLEVPAGSGPRYGEFSRDGKCFYLIDEISSQVMCYTCEQGRLEYRQTVSTLPDGFKEENICSDLHLMPDGSMLFASNRGHDSLVSYRVGKDGWLSFLSRQSCGGRTPRNFAIDPDGEYVLVGNQDSDTITVFRIETDGRLTQTSRTETGSPVCIRFFNP